MEHGHIDPLGGCQQRDQIAAAGHPFARDEAVLLSIGVETAVGPAAHDRAFPTEPAHDLTDFALTAEMNRGLDLLIRYCLRLARRERFLEEA